jgi:lipoic acid synthetase
MLNDTRPDWLTLKVPDPQALDRMQQILATGHLHTVCEGADCPNIGECFANQTCTFMIMGDICTRNCRFCAVEHGRPDALNHREPLALALTARQLGLKHVVVTSVTRDDLPDGGAGHFAETIWSIRKILPAASIEVLIPDFKGSQAALQVVLDARPDVLNHNVETVPGLYAAVRPQAKYHRSVELLARARQARKDILTKSGLMLGLGESVAEVVEVMKDLREAGCDILTLGQYLSPSPNHYPVAEYITPDTFMTLKTKAYELGFSEVSAGPLVRSSYHAADSFIKRKKLK